MNRTQDGRCDSGLSFLPTHFLPSALRSRAGKSGASKTTSIHHAHRPHATLAPSGTKAEPARRGRILWSGRGEHLSASTRSISAPRSPSGTYRGYACATLSSHCSSLQRRYLPDCRHHGLAGAGKAAPRWHDAHDSSPARCRKHLPQGAPGGTSHAQCKSRQILI